MLEGLEKCEEDLLDVPSYAKLLREAILLRTAWVRIQATPFFFLKNRYLFCRRRIEQTAEIFCDLRSTRLTVTAIANGSELARSFLQLQFFADSDQHALIAVLSFRRWNTCIYAEFPAGSRFPLQGVLSHVAYHVAKPKIARIFLASDSRRYYKPPWCSHALEGVPLAVALLVHHLWGKQETLALTFLDASVLFFSSIHRSQQEEQ